MHQDITLYTVDNKSSLENEVKANFSRRHFLSNASLGLGTIALGFLLNPSLLLGKGSTPGQGFHGGLGKPHFAPKVKRVIYLFQSGGPSQYELFDHKPMLEKMHGKDIPPLCKREPTPNRDDRRPA